MAHNSRFNETLPARAACRQPHPITRILCAVCLLVAVGPRAIVADVFPTYAQWSEACLRLPTNREIGHRQPSWERLPLAGYLDFAAALDPFLELCRTGELARAEAWLGRGPGEAFYDLDRAYYLRNEG